MKVKNWEVEVSAQCAIIIDSFGTQIEVRVRAKMDISFFRSQQVREDDRCSSWREVIMFSTSIASAPLFLQLDTFHFSRDIQTRSQTIPLHHLKKYKSVPVI